LAVVAVAEATFSCLDKNGNAVDYWVGLKHDNGFDYSVYSPSAQEFTVDEVFNSATSAFGHTIRSLYSASSIGAYAFYNDETPDMKTSSSHAHMKGVFAMSGSQGFWIIHSVPRFPVSIAEFNKGGYSFPTDETKYGQSFLCLTLSTATFDTVAQAMLIDWPQIYDSAISSSLSSSLPNLASLLNGNKVAAATATSFTISTLGGKSFTLFAKNRAWNSALYLDLVAPTFSDGLYVESWLNGVGKIGSVCHPYKVFDVQNVSLPDGDSWRITQDHSKWAITMSKHWACVGDINRQAGQEKRGGGTYCTSDTKLWNAFSAVIAEVNTTCG